MQQYIRIGGLDILRTVTSSPQICPFSKMSVKAPAPYEIHRMLVMLIRILLVKETLRARNS